MKNIIKSALKIVLVATFFCTAAFADGDMGNGSKSCPASGCPHGIIIIVPPTVSSDEITPKDTDSSTGTDSSIFNFVGDLLAQLGIV